MLPLAPIPSQRISNIEYRHGESEGLLQWLKLAPKQGDSPGSNPGCPLRKFPGDKSYEAEKGSEIADRIKGLIPLVQPEQVAALAVEARDRMNLRHVPLFLLAELSGRKGKEINRLVAGALTHVIQRADELTEFLAIYWREGVLPVRNKKRPLSAGVKRGLREAFEKFNEYHLGKYNRNGEVKLRDVLRLVHPKPKDEAQARLWGKVVKGELESPDTWEVALSAGKDKKETFERLMREGKLGGLALVRNLRGMLEAGVDKPLIQDRLASGQWTGWRDCPGGRDFW